MKNILLVNDDGFHASGIELLIEVLSPIAQVTVVAPSTNQSCKGHGLHVDRPMKLIKMDDEAYMLEGSPADCVYVALSAIFDECKPDLIVSGINIGSNMSEDITYSGTIGAAIEGALRGVNSVAFSQVYNDLSNQIKDNKVAKKVVTTIVSDILKNGFPLNDRKILNVNIPDCTLEEFKGIKISQLGYKIYEDKAKIARSPKGEEFYWIGEYKSTFDIRKNSKHINDFESTDKGYASVTPILLDMTSYEDIKDLEHWNTTLEN